jgi:hypothetical protein
MHASMGHTAQTAVHSKGSPSEHVEPSHKDDLSTASSPPVVQASLSEANPQHDQPANISSRTAHRAHYQHLISPGLNATDRVKDDSQHHSQRGEEMILERNFKKSSAISTLQEEMTGQAESPDAARKDQTSHLMPGSMTVNGRPPAAPRQLYIHNTADEKCQDTNMQITVHVLLALDLPVEHRQRLIGGTMEECLNTLAGLSLQLGSNSNTGLVLSVNRRGMPLPKTSNQRGSNHGTRQAIMESNDFKHSVWSTLELPRAAQQTLKFVMYDESLDRVHYQLHATPVNFDTLAKHALQGNADRRLTETYYESLMPSKSKRTPCNSVPAMLSDVSDTVHQREPELSGMQLAKSCNDIQASNAVNVAQIQAQSDMQMQLHQMQLQQVQMHEQQTLMMQAIGNSRESDATIELRLRFKLQRALRCCIHVEPNAANDSSDKPIVMRGRDYEDYSPFYDEIKRIHMDKALRVREIHEQQDILHRVLRSTLGNERANRHDEPSPLEFYNTMQHNYARQHVADKRTRVDATASAWMQILNYDEHHELYSTVEQSPQQQVPISVKPALQLDIPEPIPETEPQEMDTDLGDNVATTAMSKSSPNTQITRTCGKQDVKGLIAKLKEQFPQQSVPPYLFEAVERFEITQFVDIDEIQVRFNEQLQILEDTQRRFPLVETEGGRPGNTQRQFSTWSTANPNALNMKIEDIIHQVSAMYEREVKNFNESRLTTTGKREPVPKRESFLSKVLRARGNKLLDQDQEIMWDNLKYYVTEATFERRDTEGQLEEPITGHGSGHLKLMDYLEKHKIWVPGRYYPPVPFSPEWEKHLKTRTESPRTERYREPSCDGSLESNEFTAVNNSQSRRSKRRESNCDKSHGTTFQKWSGTIAAIESSTSSMTPPSVPSINRPERLMQHARKLNTNKGHDARPGAKVTHKHLNAKAKQANYKRRVEPRVQNKPKAKQRTSTTSATVSFKSPATMQLKESAKERTWSVKRVTRWLTETMRMPDVAVEAAANNIDGAAAIEFDKDEWRMLGATKFQPAMLVAALKGSHKQTLNGA